MSPTNVLLLSTNVEYSANSLAITCEEIIQHGSQGNAMEKKRLRTHFCSRKTDFVKNEKAGVD